MLNSFQKKFPNGLDDFQKNFRKKLPELWDDFCENDPEECVMTDNKLCIKYLGGVTCPGDSGGPLVTKPGDADGMSPGENYEQIGVMSYGNKLIPCNNSSYTVYARVTKVLEWIKENVKTGHTCP